LHQRGNNKRAKSKLVTENLHNSYYYLDIIKVIKSKEGIAELRSTSGSSRELKQIFYSEATARSLMDVRDFSSVFPISGY